MKLSGLLHRTRSELPGVSGVARVDRHTGALLRRLRPGDVAVLDQLDLDRATADALVAADVVAVVNAAPSISGRFPNLGPQILVDAGIPLVDAVGAEVLHAVKDGVRVRVHDGVLYAGEQVLAEGVAQTADSVADALVEAKSGLAHQLEAFAANTIEFMRRERGMLLDGVGVPDVQVDLADRQVLVVAAGYDHVADLARLRRFIREYRPRLIGVGAGADALLAAGHRPDLIVGNPAEVSEEALTCGADVVVPAFTDGHAPGLHRVQDLGAGAVTFAELGESGGPGAAAGPPPRSMHDHHGGAVGVHGRVPGPRAFGEQRLDVPHPAADRGDGRRRAGGRRAVPHPGLGLAGGAPARRGRVGGRRRAAGVGGG